MDTQTEQEGSIATLLSGIVDDAKRLLVEQLTLFQTEIKNDINRTLTALVPLVSGALVMFVSILLLGMAASYGLCALAPDLPLWAGFAIVGGVVAAIGAGLLWWGW